MKTLFYTLTIFIFSVQFGWAQPTFRLQQVSAQPGETVCMSLTVWDFTDLQEIQFSLNWDWTVIDFTSVSNFNPNMTDLSLGSFDLTQANVGKLIFAWKNSPAGCNGISGVTLFDDEIAFDICFEVTGDFGESTVIEFTDNPVNRFVSRLNANCNDIGEIPEDGFIGICPGECPKFYASEEITYPNQTICTDIRVEDFTDVISAQFSMNWNPDILEYSHVETGPLPGLSSSANFNDSDVANGNFSFAWFDPVGGIALPDDEVIFQVCFTAIGDINDYSEFNFSDNPIPTEIFVEIPTGEQEVAGIFSKGGIRIKEPQPDVNLTASHVSGFPGEEVCVIVSSDFMTDLAKLSFSLHWDENILEYAGHSTQIIPPPFSNDVPNEDLVSDGTLFVNYQSTFPWLDVSLADNLFEFCFKIIGESCDEGVYEIQFRNQPEEIWMDYWGGPADYFSPITSDGSVTILPTPVSQICGDLTPCLPDGNLAVYQILTDSCHTDFSWTLSPPIGSIIGNSNSNEIAIMWTTPGVAELCVNITDTCNTNISICETVEVGEEKFGQEEVEMCIGGTVICAGQVFSSPGVHEVTLQSSLGCDSTVTCIINLIPPISPTNIFVTLCGEDSLEVCNNIYKVSGIYTETCQNWQGCDSTVTVDLAVLNPESIIEYTTLGIDCGGFNSSPIILDGSNSVFSLASGATSEYLWNGPGILGDPTASSVEVDEVGTYCLTVKQERDGVLCENVTCVEVVNNYDMTFFGGHVFGNVGDTVVLDVKASTFQEIVSIQFSMEWNENALKFLDVQGFAVPGLAQSNFGTSNTVNGIMNISWLDPNVAGVTLSDSTTIFQVKFEILSNAECQNLFNFMGVPTVAIITDANGEELCVEYTPGIIDLGISPNLIQSITPDTTLCGGGDIQLNVEAPGAVEYHWFPQGNLSCFDCPSPFATLGHSHQYFVVVTDANGCTDEASVNVDVHFGLDWGLLPFSNAPICEGDSLLLFEELHFDIVNYEWTGPNGFFSSEAKPIIPDFTSDMNGFYYGTFTSDAGCEGTTDIFVEAQTDCFGLVNIDITPESCAGTNDGAINFEIVNGSGDYDFLWWFGYPSVIPLTGLSSGTYYFHLKDNVTGDSLFQSFFVGLSPDSPVAEAGPDAFVPCGGGTSVTLDGSGSSTGPEFEYLWESFGPVEIPSGEEIKINPTVNGIGCVKLTVINTATGCIAMDWVCINTPQTPTFFIEAFADYSCGNDTIQIDTFNVWLGSNYTFEWEIIGNGDFLNNSDTTLTPIVSGTGYYNLTVTNLDGGCSATQSVFIDDLNANIQDNPATITCDGLILNANNSSIGPNLEYEWTGPCILSDPTQLEIEVDACLGTYYFTVTDPILGCSHTDSIVVDDIIIDIELPIAEILPPAEISCFSVPVTLDGTNSSTGPEFIYAWYNDDGDLIGNEITAEVTEPGGYELVVTNTANDCEANTFVVVESSVDYPIADAGNDMTLDCNNFQVTLDGTASSVGPIFLHQWSTFSGNILLGSTTTTPIVNGAGTYYLTVINSENGCTSQDSVSVIDGFGVPPISIPDYFVCPGEAVNIDISWLNAETYQWSPPTNISDPTSPVVTITPLANTVYNVVATFDNGCESSAFFNVFYDVDCLWPGDGDTNAITNNADLLIIGLGYGLTGPTRPDSSLNWEAQFAFDWDEETPQTGINFKHADMNGNGLINADDTLAIIQNWGLIHNFTDDEDELINSDDRDENVPFYIEPDTIYPEKKYALPIILGSDDLPADNVYGVSFSINFDPEIVTDGTAQVGFENSWLGELNSDMISIQKEFPDEGRVDVAVTRIDAQNMSGFGQVGTFFITIEDIIFWKGKNEPEDNEETFFEIDNVKIISFQEDTLFVDTNPKPAVISDTKNAFLESEISVFPNPAKDNIYIQSETIKLEKTELFSVEGKLLKTTQLTENQQILNVSKFSQGVYLLKIQTNLGVLTKRIILF